jgi:pre-mRNA-processing factor 40
VVTLFKQLSVDVVTRWRTAHNLLLESDEWKSDIELRKLPTLDILLAFEDYSRVREREYEEQMRRSQVEKTRTERKAREAFKVRKLTFHSILYTQYCASFLQGLVVELVQSGVINARTKWKEVYHLFRYDDRYLNMLGNPGSNPLELFWDAVDALDQKLDAKIVLVEDAIKRFNAEHHPAEANEEPSDDKMKTDDETLFTITAETTWDEFVNVIREDGEAVKSLSQEDLQLVFKTVRVFCLHFLFSNLTHSYQLRDMAIKKQSDEKRRAERKQRHLQDDLRYALKKLPEPVDISLRYEDVSVNSLPCAWLI